MLRSMTGYGNAELDTDLARYGVEIQSINRKHLDFFFIMPKELSHFETEFRKWVSEAITRGQISLKLNVTYKKEAPFDVQPQLALASQVKNAIDRINNELNLPSVPWDASKLIRLCPSILSFSEDWQEEERYLSELSDVFKEALKKLMAMKEKEGSAIAKDILQRLKTLREAIQEIQKLSPDATAKQRQKLTQKLQELLPDKMENDERLLREIVLYAEKVDIAEEITRFNAHLVQLADFVRSSEVAIGKAFEFLLQELLRETNTIGSKASDVNITRQVVAIKGEIEKLREQIQNVE